MHPGAWIIWATCAGLVAFTTTNPFYLLPLAAVAWLVYATHSAPGPLARSFRLFLLFAIATVVIRTSLVLFGTIDLSNTVFAALEGLRLGVLLVVFGTFNSVTDPFGVLRLAPRRFQEPALAAALALSIAPRTISAVGRVREAQQLRGIRVARWRTLPALAIPVLETGMEEAVTLAESMDSRGHGRGRRTRYRPQPVTFPSVATVAAGLVSVVIFLTAAFREWGGLFPSTSPLQWPEASPVLIAALLLLAVPALFPRTSSR